MAQSTGGFHPQCEAMTKVRRRKKDRGVKGLPGNGCFASSEEGGTNVAKATRQMGLQTSHSWGVNKKGEWKRETETHWDRIQRKKKKGRGKKLGCKVIQKLGLNAAY